jgi:tetratricopeptide (TPR) repeat protein
MPTVINGIGTWYYGKRRIHTIKGVCEFCGNQADLTSYDTTLFFVVVFVPVIPIGQKRILRQCSSCKNHKVLSLAKWEQAKELDGAELLEKLQSNTRDRDTVLRAIAFSLAYQDEPLFNNIVETMSDAHAGDAAIQAQLGDAYAYFAHWEHAEAAYRASLEVADNELVREQLAWTLLKQDRPDEARPYLQHVIDNKKRDSAGTVYFLVKGYQAQGRHEEALAIMDERDQAFPDWAALKDYQQQRKVSTRYQGTDKKIRSELLTESAGGYREGNWTWRLPHWLAALVLLGGLAC